MQTGNAVVAAKLASLFGKEDYCDCVILFQVVKETAAADPRPGADSDIAAAGPADGSERLGDPLPGHTFVLCNASDWFRAKVEAPRTQEDAAGRLSREGHGGVSRVFVVPLRGAAEVPTARAAIQFAYTGQVQACSIREALEVWRHARTLGMGDCGAVCSKQILQMLEPNVIHDSNGSVVSQLNPPVLEFYACEGLWPSLDQEPRFTRILKHAKHQLLGHFSDTLKILNTSELRQQLLALPAVAVEALLVSDDFGTDTEDSVLLLLATWMRENYGRTDAATRGKLCQLVRLAQLSPAYTSVILPVLAADFRDAAHLANSGGGTNGSSEAGWFPIEWQEVAAFSAFAAAHSRRARRQLRNAADQGFPIGSPWFSLTPRRQALVHGEQRYDESFAWHVTRDELEGALRDARPGGVVRVTGTLAEGARCVFSRGFEWRPILFSRRECEHAGLYIHCDVPEVFKRDDSAIRLMPAIVAVTQLHGFLEVDRWQQEGGGGAAVPLPSPRVQFNPAEDHIPVDCGTWGEPDAMPLRPVLCHEPPGTVAELLGAWAEYLRDGKITGTLTLLPPEPEDEPTSSESDRGDGGGSSSDDEGGDANNGGD